MTILINPLTHGAAGSKTRLGRTTTTKIMLLGVKCAEEGDCFPHLEGYGQTQEQEHCHKPLIGFWQPRKAGLNKHTGKSCTHKIHKITSLKMI